jgi:hypothetical protein
MAKYSKAIGATLGALVAWAVAFGFESAASLDVTMLTEIVTVLGASAGAFFAPKNAT